MSNANDGERIRCAICGEPEPKLVAERWLGEEGVVLRIPNSVQPNVDDPQNPDRGIVCETCYRRDLLLRYNREEQYEIHMEFGYQYLKAKQMQRASAAFRKALKIKVTADSLAHLAICLNALGEEENAKNLYLMALDLDKNHFIANNNLANLGQRRKGSLPPNQQE